jgi:hypothetical protein
MHRTKAAQIYKKAGNLRAVQLLLGHTKLESTVRYLGIEVDDALSIVGHAVLDAPIRSFLARPPGVSGPACRSPGSRLGSRDRSPPTTR